ncbi:MAG: [protein-PII] uridylyltransferase, partial [Duodenibacillus sp.]|nr:[protein-PII] uridylyltransferase [Duodenibacillus sp.]
LAQEFRQKSRVDSYLRQHAAAVDRAVCALAAASGLPAQCSVCALGGYGRNEMFPFSDIDVMVLVPEGLEAAAQEAAGRFVTALWDLGLAVGSSVRTPAQLLAAAREDITAETAFLESRLVAGSARLFAATSLSFREQLDARKFFRSKMIEMRQRHRTHADTPYALEPNIKENPGGMRDLQVFLWCTKAAGFGSSWRELAHSGLVTMAEADQLTRCQQFLSELRIRLHLLRRRHADQLVFDAQAPMAEEYFKAKPSRAAIPLGGLRPSEALMKRYYVNAKSTVQLSEILLQAISDWMSGEDTEAAEALPLGEGFVARGDAMDLERPDLFEAEPGAVLKMFRIYAEHMELKRLSPTLLRALWHCRSRLGPSFRNDPANKAEFLRIVQMRYGTYHSLKNMNIWGILGQFLPAFNGIIGQMQHDLFHAYTVDQHTFRVVKFLRRYTHSSYAHEYPLCTKVMAGIPRNWRLTLAGLLHDIAKGRGGDHSKLGAAEARAFGKAFGLAPEDTDYIAFLVENHLVMSHVAQKQDTADPEVVRAFAALVGTKERLDGLFVLTVADIRATNPKLWNGWKQQLMVDLYVAAASVLTGESPAATRDAAGADRREAARAQALAAGVAPEALEAFWRELDLVYFLRQAAGDIVWHAASLAGDPRPEGASVRARVAGKAGIQVLLYVRDQRDLFARAVAYFEKKRLSVLDARIHTTRHGWALDTFLVQDNDEREPGELTAGIEAELARAFAELRPLPEPGKGKLSRRGRSFRVRPVIDLERDESSKAWILQVTCNDRLGLLFAIAVVLARHGMSLHTAKIATLDERAEDVFLISGPGLEDGEAVLRLENDLIAAVQNAD